MKTIGASRIIAACLVASGAVVAANPPSGGDYIVLGVDSNTGKLSDNNADQLYTADKIESSVYEKCVADPMWTWGFFASSLTCPRDGFYDDYPTFMRWRHQDHLAEAPVADHNPPNGNYDYWVGTTLATPNDGAVDTHFGAGHVYAFLGRSLTIADGGVVAHCSKGTSCCDFGASVVLKGGLYNFMAIGSGRPSSRASATVETVGDSPFAFNAGVAGVQHYYLDWSLTGSDTASVSFTCSAVGNPFWYWCGDCSGFTGEARIVKPSAADSTQQFIVSNAVFGGTLRVDDGQSVSLCGEKAFVRSIVLGEKSALAVPSGETARIGTIQVFEGALISFEGGTLSECGRIVLADGFIRPTAAPVRIVVPQVTLTTESSPEEEAVLFSVPEGADVSSDDFEAVCDNPLPVYEFAVRAGSEEGVVDIVCRRRAVTRYAFVGKDISSSVGWQESPVSDKDYWMALDGVMGNGTSTVFPGGSYWLSAGVLSHSFNGTYVFNSDFSVSGGAVVEYERAGGSHETGRIAADAFHVVANDGSPVVVRARNYNGIDILAPLTGDGSVEFTAKFPAGNVKSFYGLFGDNSAFHGTIHVTTVKNGNYISDPNTRRTCSPTDENGETSEMLAECTGWAGRTPQSGADYCNNFTTLSVESGTGLGGYLPSVTYDAVTFDLMAMLKVTNDVTFAEPTRGIMFGGTDGWGNLGQVSVGTGATASFSGPVTLAGTLRKRGSGVMALGGPMRFGTTFSELPVGGTAVVDVDEGGVKALSVDAFNGATLRFSADSWLEIDMVQEGELGLYGMRNTNADVPFVLDGGILPVRVAVPEDFIPGGGRLRVAICTVTTSSAEGIAGRIKVVCPELLKAAGYSRSCVTAETGDGTVTFFAELVRYGFMVKIL